MTDPSAPTAAADDFWNWFVQHEQELRTSETPGIPDRIAAELQKIDPRLGVELSAAGAKREMIVTAWSQPAAFPAARELVAAAPASALPDWRIVALKPPRGFKFAVTLDGLHVDAGRMTFDALHSPDAPGALGIRVYVNGTPATDERWERALPLIIETGLGEEAACEIAYLETAAGPPPDEQSLPIDQLAAYVKWHRERKVG